MRLTAPRTSTVAGTARRAIRTDGRATAVSRAALGRAGRPGAVPGSAGVAMVRASAAYTGG